MNKRKFSREFKLSVLREVEAGKSTAEICREHDINKDLVWRWKKEYRENPEHAFSGKGKVSTIETKCAELERTVGQLYMEIAFLKKVLKRLETLLAEERKQR